MVLGRCQLSGAWGRSPNEPAVPCAVSSGLLPFGPSSPSLALQHKAEKRSQLHFLSCCQAYSIRGFGYFSASLATVWDQTPSRLGVVHILKEQSMPLATSIFPT